MSDSPRPGNPDPSPAFEGRRLPRPHEPLVDQGAAFDVQTLVSRRRLLGLIGASVGAVAVASIAGTGLAAAATSTATEIPDETAGPYPGDGSNGPDILERSGVIRRDLRSSLSGGGVAQGVPLRLTLTVTDLAKGGVPFAGAAVYAWHCDAQGRYSMYSSGVQNETYLRGVQVADARGRVTFTTIVPGCYSGRWPHIHFEVYPSAPAIVDSTKAIATSQLALPRAPLAAVYALPTYSGSAQNLARLSLASDMVFSDDGAAHQQATLSGSTRAGYAAALAVPVDTRTRPSGGFARSR